MRLILDSFRFVSSALILCIPMNRSAVNKHFSILGFNYSPRLFTKPGNQTNRTCYYLVSKITDIVYLSYFQACTSENLTSICMHHNKEWFASVQITTGRSDGVPNSRHHYPGNWTQVYDFTLLLVRFEQLGFVTPLIVKNICLTRLGQWKRKTSFTAQRNVVQR